MFSLSPEDRSRILTPPLHTRDSAGTGGRIRCQRADFRVDEIPAYGPDGQEGAHLLLTLEKRGWNTEDAVRALASALKLPRQEFGIAGLKDRDAITSQWISAPHRAGPAILEFQHEALTLGPALPHSNKLRRGHLRGNRFEIVIRDLASDMETSETRARATLDLLAARGLPNFFGEQRFGIDGRNLDGGLTALAAGRRRKRADFITSAGQSALFNLYAALRRERGLWAQVLEGDILKKTETGGLFVSEAPKVDQARLDRGELVITGPILGSRTRSPPAGTPSAGLEAEVLDRCEISMSAICALGRGVPGTRRPLRITPGEACVRPAPGTQATEELPALPPGISLSFTLPAGSYATVLLREIIKSDPGEA